MKTSDEGNCFSNQTTVEQVSERLAKGTKLCEASISEIILLYGLFRAFERVWHLQFMKRKKQKIDVYLMRPNLVKVHIHEANSLLMGCKYEHINCTRAIEDGL